MMLTFDMVGKIVDAAIREAQKQNLPIAVSVVDSGGHLLAFSRMDGVSNIAIEVTRRKAVTANNFKLPTRALTAIASSDPAIAADFAKNMEICMVGGGMPIIVNQQCVGGIGVGGGRADQDHAIAENTLAYLLQG